MDCGYGAAGVPPAPATGGNRGGAHSGSAGVGSGHQLKTGSEEAFRDAKELSTPVFARPRVATQETAPAITAPEMAQKTM